MTLRLHVPELPGPGTAFELPAAPARHVQVRRLQPGDPLRIFDGRGGEWQARVRQMGRHQVRVELERFDPVQREAPRQVTLAVAVPAGERMDWLVEKATELGVSRICPLLSERSVLRAADGRAERKREHWLAVAVAAAEQCGRTRLPDVAPLSSIQGYLDAVDAGSGTRWLLSPAASTSLPAAPPDDLVLLSGPEGGLTREEEERALARGFVAIGLGERILRAETAPLAVLAWASLTA
jgi:16S rRNA (uracil1498-N3)-methyltransferase